MIRTELSYSYCLYSVVLLQVILESGSFELFVLYCFIVADHGVGCGRAARRFNGTGRSGAETQRNLGSNGETLNKRL